MELALKQRLLGAAVLVALAVTFLPLLVMDPAPDSGASRVPLKVPPAPEAAGDTRTLDLPLAPVTAQAASPAPVEAAPPAVATATPDAAQQTPSPSGPAAAGGDYAVHFGSYATAADAARVVASLAAAGLPAYQEPAMLGTRAVHRVRIGPYPTAADAEAARLAAGRVRGDVKAKVVVLDAGTTRTDAVAASLRTGAPAATPSTAAAAGSAKKPVATTASASPATAAVEPPPAPTTTPTASTPAPKPPAAASVGFAVQLGAFANADEATRLRDRVRAAGFAAFVEQVRTDRGTLHRVRVGPVVDRAAADALRAQVAAKLGISGIVRPHP